MTAPLRVLIVDDEPLARRGVRARLEKRAGFEIVGECQNGHEAVQAIRATTDNGHRPAWELDDAGGAKVAYARCVCGDTAAIRIDAEKTAVIEWEGGRLRFTQCPSAHDA